MAGVLSKTGYAAISALLKSKASVAALTSAVGNGDFKKTEDAVRQLQYQLDLQTQMLVALASGSDSLSVLGAGGEPIGWIGSDADKVGAWFKNLYVGGTSPDNAQIVADSNGDVTITGGITAASISFWMPIIDADPFTDNDPSAGKVSWISFPLYFAGTTYTIASGNTSSATHKHIYWVRGASALTTATEMPQDIDNYLIASNISGAHELVLNKPGAGKSITEDALVPSLLKGMAVQPATTTLKSLTSLSTTTLLSVSSGGGVLLSIHCYVETTLSGASNLKTFLDITVDGGTKQTLTLYDYTIVAGTAPGVWNSISVGRSGDMSTAGDYRTMSVLAFPFAESILVEVRTASSAASAGLLSFNVVYGLKTAA